MCVSGGEAGNLVFLWLETVNKSYFGRDRRTLVFPPVSKWTFFSEDMPGSSLETVLSLGRRA